MLGFHLEFWDYATFAALFVLVAAGVVFLVWLAGLPGRIAIARNHPDAEAVSMMGWAGFLPVVPWIQAFIWAFKPTDVVDIRRFPPPRGAQGHRRDDRALAGHNLGQSTATAMPLGPANCPRVAPGPPHLVRNVPWSLNFSMRGGSRKAPPLTQSASARDAGIGRLLRARNDRVREGLQFVAGAWF